MVIEGSCHCGNVKWKHSGPIESVTACNCTLCRRYGALWAYGWHNQDVTVTGHVKKYSHSAKISSFCFCEICGCLVYYIGNKPKDDGHTKIAVNVRLANEPEKIMHLPIDHFDGLDAFEDLPRDGRCVKDLWF